jgi:hypothetical protein
MRIGIVTAAWSLGLRIGGAHRSSAEHSWSSIPSSWNSHTVLQASP